MHDCQEVKLVLSSGQSIEVAGRVWLETRMPHIKPSTVSHYRQYLNALCAVFDQTKLAEIDISQVRRYQMVRTLAAGPSRINHELNTLSQILRRVGLWQGIEGQYEPLPLPRWTPRRVITPEEEEKLFHVAASNPHWIVGYLASSLCANTTAAGCEVRGLRLKDIDLANSVIHIPHDAVKNEFRARSIPLNRRATIQVGRLMTRAKELGSCLPTDYLLPFRVRRGIYDPSRPTRGWRSAWREMRVAADLPWIRPHDLRHQAITRLLENPTVSEETVKSIAGHVSKKILERYSHIRLHTKREALATISSVCGSSNRTHATENY